MDTAVDRSVERSSKIFILGAPRSGTTLTLNMLVRDQAYIGGGSGESQFYTDVCEKPYVFESYTDGSRSSRYFHRLVPEKELKNLFDKAGGHISFFRKVMGYYLSKKRKKYFVEKSTVHTLYFKEIIRDFDRPFILLVKRNPAANIHSMVTAKWSRLASERLPGVLTDVAAIQYIAAIYKYYHYSRLFDEIERYPGTLVLHYEDIVLDRIDVRQTISNWLGVPLDPLYVSRPFSAEVEHKEYRLDAARVEGYKDKMPLYMQRVITVLFQPETSLERVVSRLGRAWFLELPFRMRRRA